MNQLQKHPDTFVCVSECIIEKDGKILMIMRPSGVHGEGLLAFPGGKIEPEDGENSQDVFTQAAIREVREEVGIHLSDPLRFVTSSFFNDDKTKQSVVDCIFHCKVSQSDVRVQASEREVPEYFWMTREEVIGHKNTPEWVRHYISLIPAY